MTSGSTDVIKQIGFIGVGVMGRPMVRNLLKAGFEVSVYDVSAEAVRAVVEFGARATRSPAALALSADCVITMVTTGADVEQVLFGHEGVMDSIRPGTLYMDMSTVTPALTDAIGQRMREKGVEMLDAPVGRTSQHAELGKSLFMVGGAQAALARARPVLETLGDSIFHCGPLGSGIRMKVVNNFLASVTNVATGQALALAESVGIDPGMARGVMLSTVAGQGHLGTTYPAKVLVGDLSPGFRVDLVIKDLGIALGLAQACDCPLSMAETALDVYRDASARGRGADDWTVVYALARASPPDATR